MYILSWACEFYLFIYLFINFSRQQKYKHMQTGRRFRNTNTAWANYVSDLLQNIIIQNFTTYNLNIKQEYSIILFIRSRERESVKNFKIWKNKMTKLSNRINARIDIDSVSVDKIRRKWRKIQLNLHRIKWRILHWIIAKITSLNEQNKRRNFGKLLFNIHFFNIQFCVMIMTDFPKGTGRNGLVNFKIVTTKAAT
jgi:hypothetical protein